MHNLEEFSIPDFGQIPICEINGRMQTMGRDFINISTFTNAVEQHPKIHITRDLLHPVGIGDETRNLFVQTNVPFLKQLTQIYTEQGFIEAVRTATYHQHFLVNTSAKFVLAVVKYLNRVQLVLKPHSQMKTIDLIDEFSQTRNWKNTSIRCLAWHPHMSRLAVATCDDSIRIYTNDSNFVPLLRCKQQKNITSLAWRPMPATEIAVGHETGIIIWNIDFNSLVPRPSANHATILHRIEHQPVISIAWSPRGDLLVTAAGNASNLIVWDTDLNRTANLKGSKEPGNVLLKWSPSKDKLFSASDGIVFKIWNCRNWECERWTILSGRIQTACWANNGTSLLFATTNETIIYGLNVKNDAVFSGNEDTTPNHAIQLFDVSKYDLNGLSIGGTIRCMETDPKGQHLAVLYNDSNCITIFSVTKLPVLQLISSSLIIGLHETEKPGTIAFQQNFKSGACLTIGWSSGRVQHFPIVYTDLQDHN